MNETLNELLAVLFAAGEPLEISRLCEGLQRGEKLLCEQVQQLTDALDEQGSPLMILRLEDSFQLMTRPQYSAAIKDCLSVKRGAPLSSAAMEVLAIIAYNQPVTRAFVDQIRGVDSSSVVSSLVSKELVEEAGRLELPGRPIAYRTTAHFLRSFGLSSIDGLPEVNMSDIPEEQLSFE